MSTAAIIIGIFGLIVGISGAVYGFLNYKSTQKIEKKLYGEKDLIKDKILDIRQVWKGYHDKVLNDRKTYGNPMLNTFDAKIRIEDIEGHIAVLDRFIERLDKLSK